jgi:hypothetical protein
MSKIKFAGNATGTASFTFSAPGTNTDRTLLLPDQSGTLLTTATPGLVINGPVFDASQSVAVTPVSNTSTKVTLNSINLDTNGCFSTANNRFTPNVPGYYQFNGHLIPQGSTGTNLSDVTIYKNGSLAIQGSLMYNAFALYSTAFCVVAGILYMNGTTDYVELWGRAIGSGSLTLSGGKMSGALVRAA